MSPDGFEPSTPALKGQCSTRLSYGLKKNNLSRSDLVDFRFFAFERLIGLRDESISGHLNLFLGGVGEVFGNRLGLLQFLDLLNPFVARIADGNPSLLGHLADKLGEL